MERDARRCWSDRRKYNYCTASSPNGAIKKTSPANFTLTSNATRYFICTVDNNCELGQKVTIRIGDQETSASSLRVGALSAVLYGAIFSMCGEWKTFWTLFFCFFFFYACSRKERRREDSNFEPSASLSVVHGWLNYPLKTFWTLLFLNYYPHQLLIKSFTNFIFTVDIHHGVIKCTFFRHEIKRWDIIV